MKTSKVSNKPLLENTKNTNTKVTTNDTKHHLSRSLFEFLFIIGKGGFGKVWRVRYKRTQEIFALKEMSKRKILDKKSEHSINNERVFLSKLHHPFLVNMHYAFQDSDNLYLVIDILNGGDLRFHCSRYRKFSEEQTRFFIACIVHSLTYVHKNNVIHRDIKPENLILDDKGYVHLTDFGIAKENMGDNSSETSGTPGYMAPEVILGVGHSFSVDYYAIGVIGYEFMKGKRPYIGKTRREIKEQMFRKQARIDINNRKEWSKDSIDFINRLIERKQELRLGSKYGIKELKEHFWLKYYPWNELENKLLPGPFIPEKRNNFDKRYCESIDQIGDTTLLRYEQIALRDNYITAFANFYYNRDDKDNINLISNNINNLNNNNNENIIIEKKKKKITKENEHSNSNKENKSNNKVKAKTLFCLLKNTFENKNKGEKSNRSNKIQIIYQAKEKLDEKKNIKKNNINNYLIENRLNKYNSFSSFIFLKNNIVHKNNNQIKEDSLEKKNSRFYQTLKEDYSNIQYSSNSHLTNLIHSPSNYSLFNNIKNKIFQKLKKNEKNKNSFVHYKRLNSFLLNYSNMNNNNISYNTIRLSNIKNKSKIYNIKGNKTSRLGGGNKKFDIIKFSNTKKLYRNNSAEIIGHKELNQNIIKKLQTKNGKSGKIVNINK